MYRLDDASLPVIVMAAGGTLAKQAVLQVGGRVTSELWIIQGVAATVPAGRLAELAAQPGLRSITYNKGVRVSVVDPTETPENPDIQPTRWRWLWDLAYPVTVDVGGDLVHSGNAGPTRRPILGKGVTVAVVDSGVYASQEARKELGAFLAPQFVGQADFTGDGACPPVPWLYRRSVVQHDGYC